MIEDTAMTPDPAAGDVRQAPLRWPAPGLENIHAALSDVIPLLGAGAVLTTVPILFVLVVRPPFWSAGPFDGAWWMPGLISLIGVALVVGALARTVRLLRGVARAARSGYDGWTIAYAVTDATRDAGFVMQGLRQYSTLGERERYWLLTARVISSIAYATALFWIPVGFTLGVLLAGRGVLDSVGALLPLVLGPTALVLVVGFAARAFDRVTTSRAASAWRNAGKGEAELKEETAAWLWERGKRLNRRFAPAANGRRPLFGALALAVIALLLPLPLVTLALLTSVGPLLSSVALPSYDDHAGRMARLELLAPYALPVDSSITATDAGETLQVLAYVGRPSTERSPLERAPVRTYADSWLAEDHPPSLRELPRLAIRVFDEHQPFTAAEREHLERFARHPARAEFTRLARAAHADIAGGRYDVTAFAGADIWSLPIMRFGKLREAAYLHIAQGLLAAQRGEHDVAEQTFREVISVGLVLTRNSPTLIDVVIGSSLARGGAHALQLFYKSIGRGPEANTLAVGLAMIDHMEETAKSFAPWGPPDGSLRTAMSVTDNTSVPPGMRWEALRGLQLVAGCLNPNAALFGTGPSHEQWLEQAQASLVRYPAEDALFRLTVGNTVLPEEAGLHTKLVQRLVGTLFGGHGATATCASVATAVAGLL